MGAGKSNKISKGRVHEDRSLGTPILRSQCSKLPHLLLFSKYSVNLQEQLRDNQLSTAILWGVEAKVLWTPILEYIFDPLRSLSLLRLRNNIRYLDSQRQWAIRLGRFPEPLH